MSEPIEIPNSWRAGIITRDGLGLLSKLVKGHSLNIIKAEIGAGWVDPEQLETLQAVVDPMQELSFSAVSYPEEGRCVIPCKLNNSEVTESYIGRQIGLYAEDPDKGKILFYITQVEDKEGGTGIPSATLIPSYSATWNLVIYYGMADGVDVTVDPAGGVTQEEMEQTIQKYVNSVGSVLIREITIPVSGWEAAGENAIGDYRYIADVSVDGAKDEQFPSMALDIPSLDVAAEARLCATIDALNGFVRFWSKYIPKSDLTGTIMLRSENLVDPEDINMNFDVANDAEVKETIDKVFNGTAEDDTSPDDEDTGDAGDQDIATDEEVEDALNGIFGS